MYRNGSEKQEDICSSVLNYTRCKSTTGNISRTSTHWAPHRGKKKCIQSILGKHGGMHVKADQCQYGLMSRDAAGNGLVRKATGIMTNFPCIAMKLQQRCSNRSVRVHCRHVRLEGRIKAAQIYPEGLCQAICRGLCQQLEMDQRGQVLLAQFEGTEQ